MHRSKPWFLLLSLVLAVSSLPACFDLETDDSGIDNACAIGGFPVDEVCNALDDDCDGQTDEAGVCASQVLEQIRRFAPNARMVLDPSRAGPALIALPSLGPLLDCSHPVAVPEADCVAAFVEMLAPAYGIDGVVGRLSEPVVRDHADYATYHYRQIALVGDDPEAASYVPVWGAWLAVEVARGGAALPGAAPSVTVRSVNATFRALPNETGPADDFDASWLPAGVTPTRAEPRLGYFVDSSVHVDEQVPVLVYRVGVKSATGQERVVLVAARGEHPVLLDASPLLDFAVREAEPTLTSGVTTTAVAALDAWMNNIRALCDSDGVCPMETRHGPGTTGERAFEVAVHTFFTKSGGQIQEGDCDLSTCTARSCTDAGGFHPGDDVDDIYIWCGQGSPDETAVHEAGHRAQAWRWQDGSACWGSDANGWARNRQCHATLEFFSQVAASIAMTTCNPAPDDCDNDDWTNGFHSRTCDDDVYAVGNFKDLYEDTDSGLYKAAQIPGRALWLFWQDMGDVLAHEGAALDLVHLLYWEAMARLPPASYPSEVDFTALWGCYRDACGSLAGRGKSYTGPNSGAVAWQYTREVCVRLRQAFYAVGIADCQLAAGEEVCNGIDDDCDGLTDEDSAGVTLTEVCYTGPSATLDVGACRAGTRRCVTTDDASTDCARGAAIPGTNACFAEACVGEVVPNIDPTTGEPAELPSCNDVDDDCDHLVDEGVHDEFGWDGDGDGYVGPVLHQYFCPNTAPNGWIRYDPDQPVDCDDGNPAIHPGAEECPGGEGDGIDNNCINGVDDGCECDPEEPPRVCGPATGGCQDALWGADGCDPSDPGAVVGTSPQCTIGRKVCRYEEHDERFRWVCEGEQYGGPETCNAKDDDCDGVTDEDLYVYDDGTPEGAMGPCGAGDTGSLKCTDGHVVCHGSATQNACGGTADTLAGDPGAGCTTEGGHPGYFVCSGLNAVTCLASGSGTSGGGLFAWGFVELGAHPDPEVTGFRGHNLRDVSLQASGFTWNVSFETASLSPDYLVMVEFRAGCDHTSSVSEQTTEGFVAWFHDRSTMGCSPSTFQFLVLGE